MMKKEVANVYMEIAESYKKFSKCQFTQVACLFVNEHGRIISTGVNGTITGKKNCCDHEFEKREDHLPFSERNEVHAEMNAVLELARSSTSPREITVITTLSPCFNCLKHILALKSEVLNIVEIIYNHKYHRLTDDDINDMQKFCFNSNVRFMKLNDIL